MKQTTRDLGFSEEARDEVRKLSAQDRKKQLAQHGSLKAISVEYLNGRGHFLKEVILLHTFLDEDLELIATRIKEYFALTINAIFDIIVDNAGEQNEIRHYSTDRGNYSFYYNRNRLDFILCENRTIVIDS